MLALLMVLVLPILAIFVWYGWWLLLRQPLRGSIAAVFIALVPAVIALLLARLLGSVRAEKRRTDVSYRWHTGWPAYIFLGALSAIGTVNAAFVLFEGSTIVRQDIQEIRDAFDKLSFAAHRDLTLQSHERKNAELDSILLSLRQEIVNPNAGSYCGVGKAAQIIIQKLVTIVPDMPLIRGTGPIVPCDLDKANRLQQAYVDNAHAALNREREYLDFGGPEKTAFLAKLDNDVSTTNRSLDTVEGLLSDVTAYSRPDVQGPLARAASLYSTDEAAFANIARPNPTGLMPTVDISASQELGSIAAIGQIVIKHLGNFRTWVYVVLALLLDLGTIQLFTELFLRKDEISADSIDPYRKPGPAPRFLWENPSASALVRKARHV